MFNIINIYIKYLLNILFTKIILIKIYLKIYLKLYFINFIKIKILIYYIFNNKLL